MQAPPRLPATVLRRVVTIARADGWSVVTVASLGAVSALYHRGWTEAAAALLVAGAGGAELHGGRLLRRGFLAGHRWLVGAQLALLAIIWAYAWWRWRYFDADALWRALPAFSQAEIDRQLVAAGLVPELDRVILLGMMNELVCVLLALLTLIYQGGLAIYYTRQRPAIADALLASPPPAS